jgi:hypothetical protein
MHQTPAPATAAINYLKKGSVNEIYYCFCFAGV